MASDRQLYQKQMQAQLERFDATIDELKAKAVKAKADAKDQYYDRIRDLEVKREAAQDKLSELSKTGEAAWTSVKEGVDNAFSDLKSAYNDAIDQLRA